MKKEWNIWYKLFSSETSLGWDSVKNTVDASDEWNVLATGETLFVPSTTQIQIEEDDDDEDMYCPTIDLQEGSDNSEEELNLFDTIAPVGVTDELLGLNVITNIGGTSGDGTQGKRKRVGGVGGRKKQKVPASIKIEM
ncbi:uncharacterized protein LOC129314184 [Prosopis cineraria]|uniref:uncharacterized protein LOC129314184 n=1 Tax=Prosopis cineraria TaxID=364024 RepID=UPI002410AB7E|nr:uncharacterized protein LOC129314184 [Prosopis cineraria]